MPKYRSLTKDEEKTVRELEQSFGGRTLRTLLRPENPDQQKPERTRMLSVNRMANLAAGRGRITEGEAERLALLRRNRQAILALEKRGEKLGRMNFQTNRAIRTWLEHGKQRGTKETGRMSFRKDIQSRHMKKDEEIRAIRALRFLGVDVNDGTFYLKGFAI